MTPIWFQHRYKRKDYPVVGNKPDSASQIDLSLTDDEYRLLDYMFRTFDRSDTWMNDRNWIQDAESLEARKLMFRYINNSGGTMWSISSYGCDAVRAYPVSASPEEKKG